MEINTFLHYGTPVPFGLCSEQLHKVEVSHFVTKRNPARYARQSQADKKELKKRMYAFPNKNGCPVGFNKN